MDAWLLRHTTACVAVLVEDAEAPRRTSTGMAFWKPGAERPGTWERRATHANTASALDRAGESLALDPGIGASTSALPVAGVREPFLYLVERHGVVIVVGHTGCGKTTRASGVAGADTELPQYLMAAGWAAEGRRIACTQPRRVAATSIAARVAEERGHHLGDDIGYAIRFEDCTHPTRTRLVYTTPGLLFRECLRDPLLSRYSVVLVDEAHERGAYTDMLLAVLKKCVGDCLAYTESAAADLNSA